MNSESRCPSSIHAQVCWISKYTAWTRCMDILQQSSSRSHHYLIWNRAWNKGWYRMTGNILPNPTHTVNTRCRQISAMNYSKNSDFVWRFVYADVWSVMQKSASEACNIYWKTKIHSLALHHSGKIKILLLWAMTYLCGRCTYGLKYILPESDKFTPWKPYCHTVTMRLKVKVNP